MNKYHAISNTIYNEHSRPVVVMPSAHWAEKVCGYMNKEHMEQMEAYEKTNFSQLAHQMSVREELEDEEPAVYDSSYHPTVTLKAG